MANLAAASRILGAKLQAPPVAKHSAWMVLVDGQCDQIVGTEREAKRERADLIKMDCGKVTVRAFASWQEAEAYADKLGGR